MMLCRTPRRSFVIVSCTIVLFGLLLPQVFVRPSLHNNFALLYGTLTSFVLEQLWHVVAHPSHSAASLFDFVNMRVSLYSTSSHILGKKLIRYPQKRPPVKSVVKRSLQLFFFGEGAAPNHTAFAHTCRFNPLRRPYTKRSRHVYLGCSSLNFTVIPLIWCLLCVQILTWYWRSRDGSMLGVKLSAR